MAKKKLNGSVNALAEAFRNVIQEAVEPLATKRDQDAILKLFKESHGKLKGDQDAMLNLLRESHNKLKDDQDAMLNLLRESHNKLKGDQDAMLNLLKETHNKVISVEKAVETDRKNTSVQFAQINKRLGKLEKAVLRSSQAR